MGLINSLRFVGHHEEVYVADFGLAKDQRRRLADHVTYVQVVPPRDVPHLAKALAPLAHPARVMVLIDADVIVTRSLTPLLDSARSGKIVAFADAVARRFDERWSELLGLGSLRRQLYVNAGLIVAGGPVGKSVLEQLDLGCERVNAQRSSIAAGTPSDPFYYLDQDVLNAVLATRSPRELEIRDHALAPFPPFPGLRVADETRLRCAYPDGLEPFVLHHIMKKPWASAVRWNVYSRFLSRLLLGSDMALPLRREEVPLRLQTGATAWLEKRRCDAVASLSGRRGKLGLRDGLARLRQRRTSMDASSAIGGTESIIDDPDPFLIDPRD